LITIKNVVARSNLTVCYGTFGDEMFEDILELFCERWVFDVELLPKPVEMVRLGHHAPPLKGKLVKLEAFVALRGHFGKDLTVERHAAGK
jgi:hypothetical protein